MMLYRQFATQEEVDKEYDVEKSVPDFQRYAEFNINESKKARDELECLLDVPFGPTVEETLDIFPAQDPDAPILVFIHGGYWRSNSSKEFSWVARGPVTLGFTVVITNYALCPKVTLPEITRQSRAGIAWVRRSSRTFSGSRRRIYVAGHALPTAEARPSPLRSKQTLGGRRLKGCRSQLSLRTGGGLPGCPFLANPERSNRE